MEFKKREIKEKPSPFLKEKSLNFKPRLFFGPEIIKENKINSIFFKNLWLWLIIFFVLFYLFLGIKNLFSPPEIIIYFPQDNFISQEKTITIRGKVNKGVTVAINDQIIPLNQNSFEETISLVSGLNLIKISARKKFGPEKIIFRRVIYPHTP